MLKAISQLSNHTEVLHVFLLALSVTCWNYWIADVSIVCEICNEVFKSYIDVFYVYCE